MSRAAALTCLIMAAALTGANVPLGKMIIAHMPVYALLVVRFALATTMLWLISRHEPGPRLRAMRAHDLARVAVLGIVGSVLFTVFIMEGAKRTSGAEAGIITATTPIVAALAGALLKGERLTAAQGAMVGFATAGVGLLQTTSAQSHSSAVGMVLVGLGVLCEAGFIIVSRDISTVWHPLRLSLAVAAASLAASLPLALATGGLEQLASIPSPVWVITVWYALTSSIVCTALWYVAVPHVPAWMAALSTAAMPVAALAASATLAGEDIGTIKLFGAAMVVAAIALAARLPAKA